MGFHGPKSRTLPSLAGANLLKNRAQVTAGKGASTLTSFQAIDFIIMIWNVPQPGPIRGD